MTASSKSLLCPVLPLLRFWVFFFLKTRSQYLACASLELTVVIMPLPSKCWGYRCVTAHLPKVSFCSVLCWIFKGRNFRIYVMSIDYNHYLWQNLRFFCCLGFAYWSSGLTVETVPEALWFLIDYRRSASGLAGMLTVQALEVNLGLCQASPHFFCAYT